MNNEDSSKKPKIQWWKIATLTLGILLIAAAATYALTTRNSAASSGPLVNGTVPEIGSICVNATGTNNIQDLKWTQDLNTKFTDHDFIFVILPGNDSNSNEILSKRVSDASVKIEAKGVRIETITLSASDPELFTTMKRLAIGELPAVLAITNTGNTRIVTGDITEGTLLQSYVMVSQPVCVPGSGSGCCQ